MFRRHFGTGAEVSSGHFGTGAEVSWYRSVLGPKCPVTAKAHSAFNIAAAHSSLLLYCTISLPVKHVTPLDTRRGHSLGSLVFGHSDTL